MVDIESLLEGVKPPYFANSEWKPGNPVYYSGPYWDNQELGAAVNGLLNGKWLAWGKFYMMIPAREISHNPHSIETVLTTL